MPKWMTPDEAQPDVEVGDRVAIIVRERVYARGPLTNRLVILEAEETGWRAIADEHDGYTLSDGLLWSTEKDICGIADVVCPPAKREEERR